MQINSLTNWDCSENRKNVVSEFPDVPKRLRGLPFFLLKMDGRSIIYDFYDNFCGSFSPPLVGSIMEGRVN